MKQAKKFYKITQTEKFSTILKVVNKLQSTINIVWNFREHLRTICIVQDCKQHFKPGRNFLKSRDSNGTILKVPFVLKAREQKGST